MSTHILEFALCVRIRRLKGGDWSVRCKKGLWAASGPNLSDIARDAMHYWSQYRMDGEYDDILEPNNHP